MFELMLAGNHTCFKCWLNCQFWPMLVVFKSSQTMNDYSVEYSVDYTEHIVM